MERTLVERELLDDGSDASDAEIEGNLADIASANRWLGGTAVVLGHLGRLICGRADQPARILDIATGGGDIPIAVLQWAQRAGIEVQITAVDHHPAVLEIARRNTRPYPEICVDDFDIMNLPYQGRTFDFVIISQALHHLSNEQAAAVLRAANRLSRQGIIVSDFRRSRLIVGLASIGCRFVSNRLSRHDARVSLQNGFTPSEIRELAETADIPHYSVHAHGPCRLALVIDKRTVVCDTAKVVTAHHLPMAA